VGPRPLVVSPKPVLFGSVRRTRKQEQSLAGARRIDAGFAAARAAARTATAVVIVLLAAGCAEGGGSSGAGGAAEHALAREDVIASCVDAWAPYAQAEAERSDVDPAAVRSELQEDLVTLCGQFVDLVTGAERCPLTRGHVDLMLAEVRVAVSAIAEAVRVRPAPEAEADAVFEAELLIIEVLEAHARLAQRLDCRQVPPEGPMPMGRVLPDSVTT